MKQTLLIIGFFLSAVLIQKAAAQNENANTLTNEEIENYKKRVEGLVQYVENTLNFIGDPKAVPREKETAINESYLKVFKDDKVQVEDDLDENRDVPLHKDVQAYLKDIRFFFRWAEFEFRISGIEHRLTDEGRHYFKVTYNRQLKAETVAGDTVNSNRVRYMEVNLDPDENDLKIASIYTTKLNEKEEIRNWWNNLEPVWRNIFGAEIRIYDSIRLADVIFIGDSSLVVTPPPDSTEQYDDKDEFSFTLDDFRVSKPIANDTLKVDTRELFRRLSSLLKQTRIDISGMEKVRSLQPLTELSELAELYCQGTTVTNLFPLRNLNKLEILNISNTPVDNLEPLKYSTSIRELNCSYTLVRNISPLAGLNNLEILECSGLRINDLRFTASLKQLKILECSETMVHDLEPIQNLSKLQDLDLSGTLVSDLEYLSGLTQLHYLNCEKTPVTNLTPLSNLKNLEILKISNTPVESLNPLNTLENLHRIYWDSDDPYLIDTKKRREEAIRFMDKHPGTLVIFETDELVREWKGMEERWRITIAEAAGLSADPTKEELHKVLRIESIELTGGEVSTLDPLRRLYNLKNLDLNGLVTKDYSPIGELIELEELNISGTGVTDLSFVSNLFNLKILKTENTQVASLQPLESLVNLEFVYADFTQVDDANAFRLRDRSPDCLILFKSNVLVDWWQALSVSWKDFFTSKFVLSSPPTSEQLHRLLYLQSLEIGGKSQIKNIFSLAMLTRLSTLIFSELSVDDLQAVAQLEGLKELHFTQMPVSDISFVNDLPHLEVLVMENTPVDDLDAVGSLHRLKVLNISGTQVKRLNALSELQNLKELYLNNTRVKSLKPVTGLSSLTLLQCYNTRISEKNIERFRQANTTTEVVYY